MVLPGGYVGRVLRVDLSKGVLISEALEGIRLEDCIGGTGLGAMILYKEVPPGVQWSDPENRIVLASGPVSGTIRGTGGYSVLTKGPMTNGGCATQANGYLSAYLKFSGFDAIVIHGCAPGLVYLHIHDGTADIRDASALQGKDTWETEDLVKKDLGKSERQLSVHCIGPAGERKVRFAALVGDHGHVAAHGGVGAVMGSKNLKAIAVERGNRKVPLADKEGLRRIERELYEEVKKYPWSFIEFSTSETYPMKEARGWLPVKNYTEKRFAPAESFKSSSYRARHEVKSTPCWGCNFRHCTTLKFKEGPYAGFIGDEPEAEGMAAFGSQIMQTDPDAAIVMCNEIDRYGMDVNEAGWIIGWLMECYEKGLLAIHDLDGIEMTWGNVESTRKMLRKIAYREGVGDMLAEGLMRAATRTGGQAADLGIYTLKGNTPRGHDHRMMWPMALDTCVSSSCIDQASMVSRTPESVGLPKETDAFSAEGAARMLHAAEGLTPLEDSLVICKFTTASSDAKTLSKILNAATGLGMSPDECRNAGLRAIHLLRSFNARHGHTAAMDRPSKRYGAPAPEGPGAGRALCDVFDVASHRFYDLMGWDEQTGVPLPGTLRKFGLDYAVADLWK